MPLGLSNATVTFQGIINHIFRDNLDQEMSALMDDFIICSQTLEGLHNAIHEVLRRLCNNGLCSAPDKCEWGQHQIGFLGYMVSGQVVEMTDETEDTIKKIQPGKFIMDVQHFLGFANIYRRFMKDYSKNTCPMTNSISFEKDKQQFTLEIEQAQK